MPGWATVPIFPPGFHWGSATASHQVEGNNTNNDWWDWEHDPASPCVEPSGDAIDHYHRYDDDFALLASLGQNAHRFSLEWSRIEPAEGEFSTAALDHYGRMLDSLARHGLTAFVTLHHFTLPRWFAARGGWLAPDALDVFARYVARVSAALGDRMPYVCTINEPQIVARECYLSGQFPPGHRDLTEAVTVNGVLAAAHRRAVEVLRAGPGSAQLGTCLHLPHLEPLRPGDEADEGAAAAARMVMVDTHLDDLRAGGDVGDFVGLQYYSRALIDATSPDLTAGPPEGAETTLMGWEVYPAGFGAVLRRIAEAGLPVVVTENGIATTDDDQRVRYLASHLGEVAAALADGIDVRGYLYWSSFDNFEWAVGYRPTFGLVGIDRADGLRRVPRRSAELFGEVARTGDLSVLS
nr:glycoside hydrolase family 1 protein [Actinomycetospora corticicola]